MARRDVSVPHFTGMTMFLPQFACLPDTPTDCGASAAALQSMLAYSGGLEDCRITVENLGWALLLTGRASSEGAACQAAMIARNFTSRPVITGLRVERS